MYHTNTNLKKARVAVLISDKVDFRDKEGHLIVIKESTYQ